MIGDFSMIQVRKHPVSSFLKHKLDPTIKRRFGFHLPEIMPFLQEEVRFQHRILREIQCFHQLLLKMMGQGRIRVGKQVFFQVLEDFVPTSSGILQELITGIILFEQPMRCLKILPDLLGLQERRGVSGKFDPLKLRMQGFAGFFGSMGPIPNPENPTPQD